ncbi:proton channel OtopLc-like isoform X2 [Paramacrobiotus metropolitanus]|uniref:proton channel OtopLc-like isoform X2 n=1 Tax=Paramacrobiotus metropolitanus TaxID=2943436 RepID=UPI00244599AF|nr:proton channel OtopLc-like isoform X2 [Paramacrobiotus metropolitanus]
MEFARSVSSTVTSSYRLPSFYLYLYVVSLLFLLFAFGFLFNTGRRQKLRVISWWRIRVRSTRRLVSPILGLRKMSTGRNTPARFIPHNNLTKTGSFYLRVGAVVFGIGTMLYSCLEFGQYFELRGLGTDCDDIFSAITPAFRFIFSFVQLYLIFVNAKIRTDRYTNVASFGLMHMVATNMCIWLSVLIEETKHELEHSIFEPDTHRPTGFAVHLSHSVGHGHADSSHHSPAHADGHAPQTRLEVFISTANEAIKTVINETVTDRHLPSCRARTSMGAILQQAIPFVFPCIVENSLICAALLFVMWQGLGLRKNNNTNLPNPDGSTTSTPLSITGRTKQQYTVDCRGASRGLFAGILVVIITIISIALFFVWVWRPEFYGLAVYQAYLVEIFLYSVSLAATIVAFVQLRPLKFDLEEGSVLDDILLVICQMGVYFISAFVLISSRHSLFKNPTREEFCAALAAFLEMTQSTLQTLFMLDATRRRPFLHKHVQEKPGRELVTFLLVCNFAMWGVNVMEAWRQQMYPQQLRFYGTFAWTLITHISMPLIIFYRFHSSVCLSEVWKAAYKFKHQNGHMHGGHAHHQIVHRQMSV